MHSLFAIVLLVGISGLSACSHLPQPTPSSLPPLPPAAESFTGVAEQRKMGAAVRGGDFYLWIDGLQSWPDAFRDRRVTVTGVVEERHDLPVFVADTPEERGAVQGIPVPSGTDVHEASRRTVLKEATWRLED